jgi:hypothetical protein
MTTFGRPSGDLLKLYAIVETQTSHYGVLQ